VIRLRPVPFPIDVPALTASPPVEPDAGLIHATEAADRAWWLGGRRAHAEFHGLRGLVGARFGGTLGVDRIGWGSGAPATAWITPRATRFERTCPAGSFLETIWIPERLPGLLVEVRPVGSWLPDRTVRGELRLSPVPTFRPAGGEQDPMPEDEVLDLGISGDATTRWCEASVGSGLLVAAFDGAGRVPALGEPHVVDGAVGIELSWDPAERDATLTLAILAGEPSPASLRSLLVARAHARRAGPAREALRTRLGIAEVDDGVAWAWTRMRDRILDDLGPVPPLDGVDAAAWVRTALAAGLTDSARAVLVDDPRTVEQAAAWKAWASGVGSGGPIDDLAARVGAGSDLPADVRTALAEVADRASHDTWATQLREGITAEGSIGGGIIGEAPGGSPDAIEGATPPVPPTVEAWRARISEDPAALGPDGWRTLGDLVENVLGWRPDAATGRMHLTPRLPEHWTRFVLEGLRGGELRMRLERTRNEDADTWRFAPMAGAVPATLILRLPLPDERARVTVDGVPAELSVERDGGGVRAPIQLQLDRERVVRVGGTPGGDEKTRARLVLPTVSPSSP
jgi:hypothetical protein